MVADVSRGGERGKAIRFVIVGGANTGVMYGLYLLLLHLGIAYVIAVTVDYALGTVVGFLLNRYWTFRAHRQPKRGFLKYCASYAGVFCVNLVLLIGFTELVHLAPAIAQIPAIALATIASYGLQRFWVFAPA